MNRMRFVFAGVAAAAWVVGSSVACSNGEEEQPVSKPTRDAAVDSGGDGPLDAALPPIDPDLLITSLTDAQRREFCDWKNALFGGYGLTVPCGGGNSVLTDENQDKCAASGFVTRCPITVGQYEGCVLAQAPSRGCVFPFEQCHYLVCQ
jgi:hypothetical protein